MGYYGCNNWQWSTIKYVINKWGDLKYSTCCSDVIWNASFEWGTMKYIFIRWWWLGRSPFFVLTNQSDWQGRVTRDRCGQQVERWCWKWWWVKWGEGCISGASSVQQKRPIFAELNSYFGSSALYFFEFTQEQRDPSQKLSATSLNLTRKSVSC